MEVARRPGKKEDDLLRRGRARGSINFRDCFSVCLSRHASGSICTLIITFSAVICPHRGRLEGLRGCPDWWASPSSLSFWREHWRARYRGRWMGVLSCKSRISASHGGRDCRGTSFEGAMILVTDRPRSSWTKSRPPSGVHSNAGTMVKRQRLDDSHIRIHFKISQCPSRCATVWSSIEFPDTRVTDPRTQDIESLRRAERMIAHRLSSFYCRCLGRCDFIDSRPPRVRGLPGSRTALKRTRNKRF